MTFTPITDPATQLRLFSVGSITAIQTGQFFGAHNGLFEMLEKTNEQPYRRNRLTGVEGQNRPNSFSLRHSVWRAGVIVPLKGDVAIEGNTVKSGGAIRPTSGFIYPRCY